MKKHKLITILLAAALIIAALTVTTVAASNHITRGEFFTSLGKTLGLTEEETANLSFSDYNNENKIVNALVNIKYLLGRNNGTLALNDELTIKDVDYIFSRIKWPEKIVTETKYVGGGTRYITEEKLIDYSATTHAEAEIKDHLFQLAADGTYKCIFKDCNVTAPAGTNYIPTATSVPEFDDTFDTWLTENQGELTEFYLDKPTAVISQMYGEWQYQIASNALLLVKTNTGLNQIGLIEFFEKYSVNEAVPQDSAIEDPLENSQHTGWYHTFTAGDPDGEDYVELVDVVIIDKTT